MSDDNEDFEGALEDAATQAEEEIETGADHARRFCDLTDYVFDKSEEKYWDVADLTMHTAVGVDSSIPVARWRVVEEQQEEGQQRRAGRPRQRVRLIQPSKDIMRIESEQYVEGTTWWPGAPRIIEGHAVSSRGVSASPGRRLLNLYREPPPIRKTAEPPTMWIDHLRRLWPEEGVVEHFLDYCAHMVQKPGEKCNTAIVLSGTQGIGKDAALSPLREVVGVHNYANIDPDTLFGPYRPWLQSVMLVVDEVRPGHDEFKSSSMYNIMKPLIAAPPYTLEQNEKFMKQRHIMNVMRVFLTTNDWLAMYLPDEDRRIFLMHSRIEQNWHVKADDPTYFQRLFRWLRSSDGIAAIAKLLSTRDISQFDPAAPSPRTAARNQLANTWAVDGDELGEAVYRLGNPQIIFPGELMALQFDGADEVSRLIRKQRTLTSKMSRLGYTAIESPGERRWEFRGKQQVRAKAVFVYEAREASPAILRAIERYGRRLAEEGYRTSDYPHPGDNPQEFSADKRM